MTELADPTALQDPNEAFLEGGVLAPPVPVTQEHISRELGAAVVAIVMLMRRHLANQKPELGQTPKQVRSAWDRLAPIWLKLAVPAVKKAYAMSAEDLSENELHALASDYANEMGSYLSDTSGEALADAMAAQVDRGWNPELAWQRGTAVFGLDQRDMRGFVAGLLHNRDQVVYETELVPSAARAKADSAFLARAERLAEQESYSAIQSGKAIAWIWLERMGRIPAGSRRKWVIGDTESHCATCAELGGQAVPVSEPFVLVSGGKVWAPRAHPNCDCRVELLRPPELISKATRAVAGLALVAGDTGRVLMIQRAHDPKDPAGGMWEFPGGHVDEGEMPLGAAEREFAEEVRSRAPEGRYVGTWTHGVYQGFAKLVAREDLVPVHRRGRAHNPDDPDRDQIEAIAWWGLDQLARNPAVRPELRASLADVREAVRTPVSKADDEPRDSRGRWAKVAERTTEDFVIPKEPASPFGPAPASPFGAASPFSGSATSFGSPFQAPPSPFGSPFAPESPFSNEAKSPFAQTKRPNNVTRRVIVLPPLPVRRPSSTYFLPVERFHSLVTRHKAGGKYGQHEEVDFNLADSTPVAEAGGSPWNLLDDDLVVTPLKVGSMGPDEVRQIWGDLLPTAHLGFNIAMTEVGSILDKFEIDDLREVEELAGLEWDRDPEVAKERILRAVNFIPMDGKEMTEAERIKAGSLAAAYGDYVTWAEPAKFLGTTGYNLAEKLDQAEGAGLVVRDMATHPHPVEQVFGFAHGFHPGTRRDDVEAFLHGKYVPDYTLYRSALQDMGLGTPPLRFGLHETYVQPFTEAASPPPSDW